MLYLLLQPLEAPCVLWGRVQQQGEEGYCHRMYSHPHHSLPLSKILNYNPWPDPKYSFFLTLAFFQLQSSRDCAEKPVHPARLHWRKQTPWNRPVSRTNFGLTRFAPKSAGMWETIPLNIKTWTSTRLFETDLVPHNPFFVLLIRERRISGCRSVT